jgi:hypothetical protein
MSAHDEKAVLRDELILLEQIEIAASRSHIPGRDSQFGTATKSAAVVHVPRT